MKTAQFRHLLSLHLDLTRLAVSLKCLSCLLMKVTLSIKTTMDSNEYCTKSRTNLRKLFLSVCLSCLSTHFPIQARSTLFSRKESFPQQNYLFRDWDSSCKQMSLNGGSVHHSNKILDSLTCREKCPDFLSDQKDLNCKCLTGIWSQSPAKFTLLVRSNKFLS